MMAQKQEKTKSKYHVCVKKKLNQGFDYKDAQKSCESKSRKKMRKVKKVLTSYKPYKKPSK